MLSSDFSCRFSSELAMMLRFVVGALFPALLLAAPPPINKLALFPDKSAWCEAKNITQIVGHSGCESKSIQNRYGSTLGAELEAAGFHLLMICHHRCGDCHSHGKPSMFCLCPDAFCLFQQKVRSLSAFVGKSRHLP